MSYALITDASSGIGAALARTYAQHGHSLLLVARSADKLQTLAAELSAQYRIDAQVLALDLSKPDAPQAVYEFTQQAGVQIEVLVNNAGFADFGEFWQADWVKNAEMIDLNVKTLTHLTHLYLPGMVARKSGRVLNVARPPKEIELSTKGTSFSVTLPLPLFFFMSITEYSSLSMITLKGL